MKNIKNFITESKGTERPVTEAMKKSGRYFVKGIWFSATKDDYKEGETGKSNDFDVSYSFYGDTVTEVVESVLDYFEYDKENAVIFDDYVMCDALVNKDNVVMSKKEIELWKQGKMDAWNLEMRFEVFKIEGVGHDELVKETGIESYD